jgi:hypothetical protein
MLMVLNSKVLLHFVWFHWKLPILGRFTRRPAETAGFAKTVINTENVTGRWKITVRLFVGPSSIIIET